MRTFFSISDAQAGVSPFAACGARAGVVDVHWNGLETYEVSSRWSIGASEYMARCTVRPPGRMKIARSA